MVVGHRGGRGPGWPPENTIAAFEKARAEGAHAVELDVRTCATGEAVVFHDPDLTRLTAGADRRRVASVPWLEIRVQRLLGGQERIPSVDDVLDWAHGAGMPLNVEVKHDVPRRLTVVRAVARALKSARVPVLLSSFDPVLLAMLAMLAPRVPRALLTDPKQRYARLLHEAARTPFLFALHVERSQARPESIRAWKRRSLRVGAWTVNDPDEARSLAAAGIDLLITDRPGTTITAVSKWISGW